jgi:hypothetical protein
VRRAPVERSRRAERALALAALALAATAGFAAELGTLFHSAEERARLDRLRRGEAPSAPVASGPVRSYAPEVTGFVKRSDGRNTVWIDGRALPTANPNAAPLFDPRRVRDAAPLPDSTITVTPEPLRPSR